MSEKALDAGGNEIASGSSEDFPLVVREPYMDEHVMVLANWKAELNDARAREPWGKGLRPQDFWRLANHVIDRITYPSCRVFMGAHPDNIATSLAWMAVRDGVVLQSYVRGRLSKPKELRELVESTMLSKLPVHASFVYSFDPFRELER